MIRAGLTLQQCVEEEKVEITGMKVRKASLKY